MKMFHTDSDHRNTDKVDVLSTVRIMHFLGAVIDKITSFLYRLNIIREALRIDPYQNIDPFSPTQISLATHSYLKPGRKTLNVGGEYIFRGSRNSQPEY
jgi:hypothetical protein